ncbi:MAG TPA: protein-L-isoaspartate(D-aspartate) O-methyltransferase [Polyangiaceae bacterium]|nr:protein-L-isoaspartate(D-aspartate) O-methyltransferase [Polyangiaceae bacterium]
MKRASEAPADKLLQAIEAGTKIHDPRILEAFRSVPRERFVPDELVELAWEDRALPIGEGQTISQPSMLALMLEALGPTEQDRALEVGAGSGYAAALLARLTKSVDALEIRPDLAARAERTLSAIGVTNVRITVGNGELGMPDRAPFDVILVSAGARATPPALIDELALGGRIAIPVGDSHGQHLFVGTRKSADELVWERRTPCVFVPLVREVPPAKRAEPTPSRPFAK